jgi:hypothetical protein
MSDAVRLTVVPDAAEVVPGGQLSLTLTVQNTGHSGAHYRLDVSGIPADWYDLDRSFVALLPGASAQTRLTVHPPASPAAMAGRYTLAVHVRAAEDPAIQPSTVVALTVSTGGLDMDVQPAEVEGCEATFRITFVNRSHTPTPVRLSASDHEDRLRFRIEPEDTVIVPAGEAADPITVHVAPTKRETRGRPRRHQLEFRGQLLGSEHTVNPSLVGQARFTYVARSAPRRQPAWLRRAPRWAVLLPLVLLLVFAGGRVLARPATRPAATRPPAPTRSSAQPTRPRTTRATVQGSTLSRPSIRLFTLVHRHRGQPYELVWQMSGAAHATLDGRPVSARGNLVLQAPLHSATYRLAATNGARRATASLHLLVDALTTDARAVVLTTPDIATFAVRRSKGQLYAIWLVRNAVHVRLQGRLVASAGARLVPPGATWLRLVATNDVGTRQRLLPLAHLVRPATPRPRPTMTATARPHSRPLAVVPRPTATPTAPPTAPPTATPTARPTATPTARPTVTPTARPTRTPTPVSLTIGWPAPPVVKSTPTAVPLTCCPAQS